MTGKKAKRGSLSPIKSALLWAGIGIATAALVSLAATAVALRSADPIKAALPTAAVCIGLGGVVAAFGAAKGSGALWLGFAAGGLFASILLLFSLLNSGGSATPLPFLSAAAGCTAGAFSGRGKKQTPAKRLKRLVASKSGK